MQLFVDQVKIRIRAGKGGDGAISFHREKYVAAGGPDGCDGGRGGNVVFQADTNLSTLLDFRYKHNFAAEDGQNGGGKRCTGKSGKDLIIRVPQGTVIKEAETGRILADMSGVQPKVLAKGGRGGWGNSHFATPTRQVPNFARPGLPGESFELELELKLLADVGLVGFPNIGKSTLISVVSAARPKIANYHFTTLVPVLGVVSAGEEQNFVVADIPGLIEGAGEGIGLGHAFLRHVERCRLIVHVLDASGCEGRDPREDFEIICRELQHFNPTLAQQPMLVAANKCDIATPEQLAELESFILAKGMKFYPISAATHQGVRELVQAVWAALQKLPPIREYEPEELPPEVLQARMRKNEFTIRKEDGIFIIEADWLLQVLGSVNMEDYESLQYFQRVLRQSGIIDKLEAMGVQDGDTVSILNFAFEYVR